MTHNEGLHDAPAPVILQGTGLPEDQGRNRRSRAATPTSARPAGAGTTAEAGGPEERTTGRDFPGKFPLWI